MCLSASGASEAAVPVAADLASLCTVAPVVTSSASPPASSHTSAVPVTSTAGVTSFLPTSRSLTSPPEAPPRRRRAPAKGEYCLPHRVVVLGGSQAGFVKGTFLRY